MARNRADTINANCNVSIVRAWDKCKVKDIQNFSRIKLMIITIDGDRRTVTFKM